MTKGTEPAKTRASESEYNGAQATIARSQTGMVFTSFELDQKNQLTGRKILLVLGSKDKHYCLRYDEAEISLTELSDVFMGKQAGVFRSHAFHPFVEKAPTFMLAYH